MLGRQCLSAGRDVKNEREAVCLSRLEADVTAQQSHEVNPTSNSVPWLHSDAQDN